MDKNVLKNRKYLKYFLETRRRHSIDQMFEGKCSAQSFEKLERLNERLLKAKSQQFTRANQFWAE